MIVEVDYVRPVEAVIPGVQGRVLGVLARTEAELTMRTVAKLAGVGVQQTSVVLRRLVELGIVARREAGSAALVRLERESEVVQVVLALAQLRERVLDRLRAEACRITPAPAALITFGSFVRGEAVEESDLDVLAIRPRGVSAHDDGWTDSLGRWQDRARRIVGNSVNLLELSSEELGDRRIRRGPLWQSITEEGVVLAGTRLHVRGGRLALADGRASAHAVS
jgi:predicted nucleotidyltransferase